MFIYYEKMSQVIQEEHLYEAKLSRLSKQIVSDKPKLSHRFLYRSGQMLTTIGGKLVARYECRFLSQSGHRETYSNGLV
jgi:hypothetical protein